MYTLYLKIILSTFSTTPIALIKTSKEVEPAEINGSGKPVGGIEPVNIRYCIITQQCVGLLHRRISEICKYICIFFHSPCNKFL